MISSRLSYWIYASKTDNMEDIYGQVTCVKPQRVKPHLTFSQEQTVSSLVANLLESSVQALDDYSNCVLFDFADIEECVTGDHNCSPNAICANVPGSFLCNCKTGYTGDGVDCMGMSELLKLNTPQRFSIPRSLMKKYLLI